MIYLDHAATTSVCKAAQKSIIEHLNEFGNPSSSHEIGRRARVLIEDARERIAKCINAEPDEVYFTSGGSEANTWALSEHTSVSTGIEHHSVRVDYGGIKVDKNGLVNSQSFSVINHRLARLFELASCMYVNNELGTIQPVKEIAKIVHGKNMLFHTDAVQAMLYIPIDIKELDCDMLSMSAHKFGGLKGVGALFIKNGVNINPLIYGGKQERGVRGGTENILGIISMAAALEDAVEHMEERNTHIKYLRDKLLDKLLQIPGSHLNGSLENRVCSNINIRFDGVPGARLVALCSLCDIYISSGSACNEGIAEPSHVLKAIGLTDDEALSSVRITIGHTNTEQEINIAAGVITALVKRIREEQA